MLKILFPVWIAVGTVLSGCPYKTDKEVRGSWNTRIRKEGKLPRSVTESSGLVYFSADAIYTINDSGNPPTVYHISREPDGFSLMDSITLDVPNRDWESLTKDNEGNIWVGDVGNNSNARTDLQVHQLDNNLKVKRSFPVSFPDQHQFPPEDKQNWRFDCEAMAWWNDQLLLFSKSMRHPYSYVYALSPEDGSMMLVDSLHLKAPVTGADIRGTELVLLSYGKIFFYTVSDQDGKPVFSPVLCKKFEESGQSEAIAFMTEHEILVTNENRGVFVLTRDAPEENP